MCTGDATAQGTEVAPVHTELRSPRRKTDRKQETGGAQTVVSDTKKIPRMIGKMTVLDTVVRTAFPRRWHLNWSLNNGKRVTMGRAWGREERVSGSEQAVLSWLPCQPSMNHLSRNRTWRYRAHLSAPSTRYQEAAGLSGFSSPHHREEAAIFHQQTPVFAD